jgi:phage terminase Nu1 subunit (DNA packaging protein)
MRIEMLYDTEAKYVRLARFAEIVGIDYRTAQRYAKQGMPMMGKPHCAKIVYLPAAIAWLTAANRTTARGRPKNVDRAKSKSR